MRVNLNRRLVLERAERVADGAGGFQTQWQSIGTLWAEVVAASASDVAGVETTIPTVRWKITLRAAPVGAPERPQPRQRLRDAGRVFQIVAVAERDAAGRYLLCHAVEEGAP